MLASVYKALAEPLWDLPAISLLVIKPGTIRTINGPPPRPDPHVERRRNDSSTRLHIS